MTECRMRESYFDFLPKYLADFWDCDLPSVNRSIDSIHSFIDDKRKDLTMKLTKREILIVRTTRIQTD